MNTEKKALLNLLYTSPDQLELIQTLSESTETNIESELEEMIKLSFFCYKQAFYEDYCCDYCSGTLEDAISSFSKKSLKQKLLFSHRYRQSLKEICFYQNEPLNLPSSFPFFPQLEVLRMNHLQTLPILLFNLINFTQFYQLDFHACTLDGAADYLKHLDPAIKSLRFNYATKIPSQLFDLTQLKTLEIRHSDVDKLPASIGQLEALEYLYLSDNSLKELPEEIGLLKNLKVLDLSNNNLISLPKSIGQLSKLEQLILNGNQLKELPFEFGHLNIHKLDLGSNFFIQLPESFKNLTRLEYLNMEKNEIYRLTESFTILAQLPMLKKFTYKSNPILKSVARQNLSFFVDPKFWTSSIELRPSRISLIKNFGARAA